MAEGVEVAAAAGGGAEGATGVDGALEVGVEGGDGWGNGGIPRGECDGVAEEGGL